MINLARRGLLALPLGSGRAVVEVQVQLDLSDETCLRFKLCQVLYQALRSNAVASRHDTLHRMGLRVATALQLSGTLRMRLRATLRFLRLRMRWPQRVRTVTILRMSECKRGCVFHQILQGPGFSSVKPWCT
jgi:hypothetical protein